MKRLIFSLFIVPFVAVIILIGTAMSYPDFCFNVEPNCGIGCHYDDYLVKCFDNNAGNSQKATQMDINEDLQNFTNFDINKANTRF